MSGLPPALAPWAPQLSAFAPELAVSLGGWARRLAAALGPLGGARAGAGEPDGLAGLARRGPYERLVATEWLLADELPHEFLRRAAAGEHLFLDRGVRPRTAERRSVALLDAGPDQLGTPRLAQLAVLVVLAARAEGAGVSFAWGIAQDPASGLVEGFGEAQARRFLAARSPRPPDAAALRAWDEALPPAREADDRWMVGGPALAALAPGRAVRVVIDDVADPASRDLRVEVVRAGARREVALPLPPRADCTRLFRDPFGTAVAAPVPVPPAAPGEAPGRIIPEAGILWSHTGQRVAVRLEGGFLLDAHVPGSPRQPPGRATRHRADGLVGFGWAWKRQVLLAARGDDALYLRVGRDVRRLAPAPGTALPPRIEPGTPLGACIGRPSQRNRLWLHHPAGTLYVSAAWDDTMLRVEAEGVSAAMGTETGSIAYVTGAGPSVDLVTRDGSGGTEVTKLGPGTGRAFLSAPAGWPMVAHEREERHWFACHLRRDAADRRQRQLHPPRGVTVVGLTLGHDARPALLLLEEDRRDFTLLGENGCRLVHGAAAEVVSVAVSPVARAFAYTTRAGALVVHSLERQAVVLEVVPGGERPRKGPMP